MKHYDIVYKVEMYSDWHCGSGLASGADADAVVVKDKDGLPYVPGRTLKGLVSEALDVVCGKGLPDGMFFSDAVLQEDLRTRIVSETLTPFMYRNISAVKMTEDGVTEEGTLRTVEVAVPCIMYARILNVPEESLDELKNALKFVKRLGYNRHRGLGRCGLSFESEAERTEEKVDLQCTGTLYFKCRLLSDVVLSQTSATSGPQTTLDFIPGSCFWGIVADGLYKIPEDNNEKSGLLYDILYSGNVRFGDAHPSWGSIRGLRMPASFYYPKDTNVFRPEGEKSEVYVHHKIKEMPEDVQLKQCRSGFVVVDGKDSIMKVQTETEVSVKSAWDRKTRSTAKSQLFTYESLSQGLDLLFSVEIADGADKSCAENIVRHLSGRRNVGRSRSAQYGFVEIVQVSEEQYGSIESDFARTDDDLYTVYADSRLIFLDDMGLPHFRPSPEELGFAEGARILWEKSQIRTFSYSSFNAYRNSHNSDYTGIEKGSVFVVSSPEPPHGDGWIGSFRTEGFGHVLYNPSFLVETDDDGKSTYSFLKGRAPVSKRHLDLTGVEETLYEWLSSEKKKDDVMSDIFRTSNSMRNYFNSAASVSQWGQIRQIAIASSSYEDMTVTIEEYISKGISSKYWQGKSGKELKDFLEVTVPELCSQVDIDRYGPMAVVNLASVMIKKAQSGKKNKNQ